MNIPVLAVIGLVLFVMAHPMAAVAALAVIVAAAVLALLITRLFGSAFRGASRVAWSTA